MDRWNTPFAGKHLLLVGTGGVKRRRVLEALCALGLERITCLHDAPNWAAPYVDDWIVADSVHWSPETLDTVRAHGCRPDGVLTYDDYSVVAAAHLAHELGLVGVSPLAAERAKDKHAFRAVCRAHGLPAPRSLRVEPDAPDAAARTEAHGLSYPVVVKPTHGGGSVLVRKAEDRRELEAVLASHARALETEPATALWPDRSVVVEEYLAGAEVDVDVLLQGGQVAYAQVSDNLPPVEPYFLELGGAIPSTLPAEAQRALIDLATRTLAALGVGDCCVHFEARMADRGPVPIEANLRLGGAEVYEFHRGAFGVDLVEAAARIALGIPLDLPSEPRALRHLRSTAFIPPTSGRLRCIDVPPEVLEHPDLGEVCVFRAAGDEVCVPPEGFDYVGWMVAGGETPEAAESRLRELAGRVRIEVGSALAQEKCHE